MADDPTKTAADRKRINPDQDHEVRYWAEKWGVTHEELKAAAKRAGPMADDVARALGKQA